MNHEEEIEQTLKDIQVDLDWTIMFTRKCKRRQQQLALLNPLIQIPQMCWNFYSLKYGLAFLNLAIAVGLACMVWWSFAKTIQRLRERKRTLAVLKMRGQQLLERWRGYKN
jgi:hypothetical protein